MARLTWLADVLRAAGLTVVEVPGWERLGSDNWSPTGGIVHATADGAAANPVKDGLDDAGAISVIRNGRPGLVGPIANAYHARDGRWHVIASGRCNTALTGTAGPLKGLGNTNLLGIEHENDNKGEPWPQIQYDTAVRGWAAICRRLGWSASRLAGHKEHDPKRKSDPKGIDMARFRADVARRLAGEDDDVSKQDVIDGLYVALAYAADPSKAPNEQAAKVGRQTRDALRAILGPTIDVEALDAAELTSVLAGPAGQALADRVLAGLAGKPLGEAAEALRAVYGPVRAAELGALLTAGATPQS